MEAREYVNSTKLTTSSGTSQQVVTPLPLEDGGGGPDTYEDAVSEIGLTDGIEFHASEKSDEESHGVTNE